MAEDTDGKFHLLRKMGLKTLGIIVYGIAIGFGYTYEDGNDCKFNLLVFLKVAGIMGLLCHVIDFLFYAFPLIVTGGDLEKNEPNAILIVCTLGFIPIVCPIYLVATLILEITTAIWGSIVVFKEYTTWNYEDRDHEYFCDHTLYAFSFGICIVAWCYVILWWGKKTFDYFNPE